ncbi:hypothetical protein [Amycolatopsis anabasis]|uniref:hypothetical protein n=1 Tax=Amycolatopsis anabasis TaxID=1840409 RepID=UPI00131AE79D|nr:hypothetical protein [Amycolatopsis anabasis]
MTEEPSVEPAERVRMVSGRQLQRLAVAGGFRVDESTGDRMIQALEGMVDSLNARWAALQKVQQSPPMSTTATANWVSGHMVATAADERGLLTQLQQARAELPRYVEAIRQAKRNYRQHEEGTRAHLKAIAPDSAQS